MDEGIWEHYDDVSQTVGDINERAKLHNCTTKFAGKREVFIDLDDAEARNMFVSQWNWFHVQLPDLLEDDYLEEPSKSGNLHVTVYLKRDASEEEKLLIACVLGSDVRRELLNYTRLKTNGDALSCFFVPGPKLLTDGSDERSQQA